MKPQFRDKGEPIGPGLTTVVNNTGAPIYFFTQKQAEELQKSGYEMEKFTREDLEEMEDEDE